MMPGVFSEKQRRVLSWWRPDSPDRDMDAVICDGAVRSGKTLAMGLSFFLWAMTTCRDRQFALCGKTMESVRRNLLVTVLPLLSDLGFSWEEKRSRGLLYLRAGDRMNTFYLFGGRDEGSAALIQGVTLYGVLLDEVALMPRSFVEQALARCSSDGARFWFSCNPEGPNHWFYKEWILKAEARNVLYLHFTMADNPGLGAKTVARYERAFHGAFYRRFVLGEWVAAEGLVYDFIDESYIKSVPQEPFDQWCISFDYGTRNPTSMGLWGRKGETWYRVKEFYYDARAEGRQKTDGEYVEGLKVLAGDRDISWIVGDPSAASFLEALRREGFAVKKADNDVLTGIRRTAQALKSGQIVICAPCKAAISEFAAYCWDLKDEAGDRVKKDFDHAMDDIRYFVMALGAREERDSFFAVSVERDGY